MYNTIHVGEVRRLHAKGLNDYQIADISGIPRHTVRRIRISENLKPVKRRRKPHTAVYEICHPDTGEVLFTGDAPKAAAFVGLDNISSFFTAVTRSNKGTYRRYIIRNVKGKERIS
jgi:hypothetical protein